MNVEVVGSGAAASVLSAQCFREIISNHAVHVTICEEEIVA
jgi:hypothetical protein